MMLIRLQEYDIIAADLKELGEKIVDKKIQGVKSVEGTVTGVIVE
ncbi:MAG: hypothetical protein QW695_01915 [Candidatus Bathyarchaeia archaeon]